MNIKWLRGEVWRKREKVWRKREENGAGCRGKGKEEGGGC